MKEQIKTPEKIQLSNEEIANLSDAQFKTLVITGNHWVLQQHKKDPGSMKVALCELKKNTQGPNTDGKEIRTQINDLEQKEEINIQPEQNEETTIQKKMRRGLGTSRTTLKIPTSK